MRKKISPELKQEILNLPMKEKDKLLVRLIPKAKNLIEQLEFKLLELSETTEERRSEVDDELSTLLRHYIGHEYSSKHSVRILRDMSGRINHHVAITKDKYGDAELNLKIILASFDFTKLESGMLGRMVDEKYYEYIIKRMIKVFKLIGGLHSDYHLDFSDRLIEIYERVHDNTAFEAYAKLYHLDLDELENGSIPEVYQKN